jgi:hypothetical protein
MISRLEQDPESHEAVRFDTTIFASALGQPMERLASKYPWMNAGKRNDILRGSVDTTSQYHAQYMCIMSVYTAETGQQVMENYVRFRHAVRQGEFEVAISALSELAGRYPENDVRASHSDIRTLVGRVCVMEQLRERVHTLINDYCSSLRTDDPRAKALRADLLRRVAIIAQDPAAALQAAASYAAASRGTSAALPNISRTYSHKSTKLHNLAAKLMVAANQA